MHAIEYTPIGQPESDLARVRFTGRLLGQEVTWDATLLTLERYARDNPGKAADGVRNFIDIGLEEPEGVALTIGLNVPAIDAPTIQRAIIMVRQYKRLAPGRHEYGEYVRFS